MELFSEVLIFFQLVVPILNIGLVTCISPLLEFDPGENHIVDFIKCIFDLRGIILNIGNLLDNKIQ